MAMPHIDERASAPKEFSACEPETSLWTAFAQDRNSVTRDLLVLHYVGYAKALAARLYSKRFNDEISFDEYYQYAQVGLIESIDRFEAGRGAQFKTYATQRIIGSVLNGLEHATEKQQQLAAAKRARLAKERADSLLENSNEQALSDGAFFKRLSDVSMGIALSIMLDGSGMIEIPESRVESGYFEALEVAQLQQRLRELVSNLPDSERRVVSYHYFQSMQFEEIARILELSKGRISQIHKRAVERLGERMDTINARNKAW